jgi:hypothetical protein
VFYHCAIAQHDFPRPSKTRANKKVAIKELLFATIQVVFVLALDEIGNKIGNEIIF